jgi:hypothetical protein
MEERTFLGQYLASLLGMREEVKKKPKPTSTPTPPPASQKEEKEEEEKPKVDEGFELIKSLLYLNRDGFGGAKSSPIEGDRNSIHIFPAKIAGKMNLKITFVLHPINGLDWKDIDNAISLEGGLASIMAESFKIQPQKKVFMKVHDYGPEVIKTWIPLYTDLLPALSEYEDTLYTKENSAIGFVDSIMSGKVILSKHNVTFPESAYNKVVSKFQAVAHNRFVIMPDNEAIYTVSFAVPVKDNSELETVSKVIEDNLYGFGAFKDDRDNPELYVDHIYFHKSGRYEDGMFSSRVYLDGSEIKEESINF